MDHRIIDTGGLSQKHGSQDHRLKGTIVETRISCIILIGSCYQLNIWIIAQQCYLGIWLFPFIQNARPGFESLPEASPQCGLGGGRSHCNTVHIIFFFNYTNGKKKKKVIRSPFSILKYYNPVDQMLYVVQCDNNNFRHTYALTQ